MTRKGDAPMVRDMRMSSVRQLGEMGAGSSAGSFHLGFHSHLHAAPHVTTGRRNAMHLIYRCPRLCMEV
jgi:hypothetical protein